MTCDLSEGEMKVVTLRFFLASALFLSFFWDGIMFACERLRLQILPLAKKKKRPESIVSGAGGLCCSDLTGVEKGISACPPPANVTPLLIITAEEVKERERHKGESRLLLNMLSIKSVQGFGWVWLGRLGFCSIPSFASAHPPYISLERTPRPDGNHPN